MFHSLFYFSQILKLVGREHFMDKVTNYIHEVLKPYYIETLESCAAPGETAVTKPAPDFRRCVIQTIVTNAHCVRNLDLLLKITFSLVENLSFRTEDNKGKCKDKPLYT